MIRFTPRLEDLDGRNMPSAGVTIGVGEALDSSAAVLRGDDQSGPPDWVTVAGGLRGGVVLGGPDLGISPSGIKGEVSLSSSDPVDTGGFTVDGGEQDSGIHIQKASPKLFLAKVGEEIPT